MVMARLFIICGNCGANEGLTYIVLPGVIRRGKGADEEVFIKCSNCDTSHALTDTVEKCLEPVELAYTQPNEFRVNKPGQIKTGDLLRIVGKTEKFNETTTAQEIINRGTRGEEVLLDIKENRYFIIDNYIKGYSWAKDVYIVKRH